MFTIEKKVIQVVHKWRLQLKLIPSPSNGLFIMTLMVKVNKAVIHAQFTHCLLFI